MSDDQNPKIVQPGDVEFDGAGATKPDTLDTVVQQSAPASPQAQPQGDVELLKHLDEEAARLLKKVHGTYRPSPDQFLDTVELSGTIQVIKPLLSQIVTLTRSTQYSRIRVVTLEAIPADYVAALLQKDYGNIVAQSGVFEQIGLDRGMVNVIRLEHYFPEFSALRLLKGKIIPMTQDPYLTILSMPMDYRAFFTGLTEEMGQKVINHCGSATRELFKPWTFRDILNYANKRGEVSDTTGYVDFLEGVI